MSPKDEQIDRAVTMGGLGTGTLSFCEDGRFRSLQINNNRNCAEAIPVAPHSFLAVRVAHKDDVYLRRLQTPLDGHDAEHLLPPSGLAFRGDFPQADCRVNEAACPVDITFGIYAPFVPYDYEASTLPLLFIAFQVTNTSDLPQDVSTVMNWQNLCGHAKETAPHTCPPIERHVVVTEDDWENAKHNRDGDNERRLHTGTGKVAKGRDKVYFEGDIAPNALRFNTLNDVENNADGQYGLVTRWSDRAAITHRVWDPEDPPSAQAFWEDFSRLGGFERAGDSGPQPRCGALCNRATLAPGEKRTVEFVISWYAPRYVVGGVDQGNYYANTSPDALAIAKKGLVNGTYYHASVSAWRQRLGTTGYPWELVRPILASCTVLSGHALHTQSGAFGLVQGSADPRVNYLRDRWHSSLPLLLFYPRLEMETLERIGRLAQQDGQRLLLSEGMGHMEQPEYIGPGAAQVESGATLVLTAYRNYLYSGNLPAISQLVPHLQRVMAQLLAQDKNLDGFPDIQSEGPGLEGAFATGLNVITAGIWLVALQACEALVAMKRMPPTPLYARARERATQHFERYFWDEQHGYYTLYPADSPPTASEPPLNAACHPGQLTAVWMADVLGFDEVFPETRIRRAIAAVTRMNLHEDGLSTLAWPEGGAATSGATASQWYRVVPYVCVRLHREPFHQVYRETEALIRRGFQSSPGAPTHVSQLAPWYLFLAQPVVQMRVGAKRLLLRPDARHSEEGKTHTLITPRGFGEVVLHVKTAPPFRAVIRFSMDVPVELTAIYLHLDSNPGPLEGSFELPEGAVPITIAVEEQSGGATVQVFPAVKTSASSFELTLRPGAAPSRERLSKKQWLPHWLQRGHG